MLTRHADWFNLLRLPSTENLLSRRSSICISNRYCNSRKPRIHFFLPLRNYGWRASRYARHRASHSTSFLVEIPLLSRPFLALSDYRVAIAHSLTHPRTAHPLPLFRRTRLVKLIQLESSTRESIPRARPCTRRPPKVVTSFSR